MLAGLLLIGMCLAPRASDLGPSTLSASSRVATSASSSVSSGAPSRATRLAANAGEPTRVVIVADAPGKLVEDARLALAASGRTVEVRILEGDGARAFAGSGASGERIVFLAAGKKSALALARSSIATKAAFLVKREDAPESIASVVLEPSPEEQLAWARIAFPGRTRVIVPRSPSGAQAREDDRWRAAATKTGLTLALVDVKSAGEAVPALEAALKGAPSIIVFVADAVAVTADTVAPLVKSALGSRTPAIGFSTYFLKVGALGAISVDAGAMASQALALALDASASRAVSPERARLIVDGKLAERLGVVTRDGPGVEVRR